MSEKAEVGRIAWTDLTVPDAGKIRDFYARVARWEPSPVSMGDYDDYAMCPVGTEDPVAGICHTRGVNAELPPVWIPYIIVEDLEESLSDCGELGGEIVTGPKSMGPGTTYAVIRDPAGAVAALYQTGA